MCILVFSVSFDLARLRTKSQQIIHTLIICPAMTSSNSHINPHALGLPTGSYVAVGTFKPQIEIWVRASPTRVCALFASCTHVRILVSECITCSNILCAEFMRVYGMHFGWNPAHTSYRRDMWMVERVYSSCLISTHAPHGLRT